MGPLNLLCAKMEISSSQKSCSPSFFVTNYISQYTYNMHFAATLHRKSTSVPYLLLHFFGTEPLPYSSISLPLNPCLQEKSDFFSSVLTLWFFSQIIPYIITIHHYNTLQYAPTNNMSFPASLHYTFTCLPSQLL